MLEALSQRLQGVFGKLSSKGTVHNGAMGDAVYPEWEWIQRSRKSLEQQYAGRWIAVAADKLVAVADTPADLVDQTKEYDRPFMYRVPAKADPAVAAGPVFPAPVGTEL